MTCSNDKPIVHCKNCRFKVTDKDGNYNPYNIVCEYWNSDGLEENDFCSQGIEGKFEYDELAVTSDCKTYDEIVQESFEPERCDATTYGLMEISDNLIVNKEMIDTHPGRCDNCKYSEELYFDGEKWRYRCESLTSPMGGGHVEGNWSCKRFCEKER